MNKSIERYGSYNRNKTHCPQGHPYNEDNIRIGTKGKYKTRHCRKCGHNQTQATEYRAKQFLYRQDPEHKRKHRIAALKSYHKQKKVNEHTS